MAGDPIALPNQLTAEERRDLDCRVCGVMAAMIIRGKRLNRPPTLAVMMANFTPRELEKNLYVAAIIAAEQAVEDELLGLGTVH